MKILVTGAAGFIGFYLSKKLLDKGHQVFGLDNINDYYDTSLKYGRLKELGVLEKSAKVFGKIIISDKYDQFKFIRLSLEENNELSNLFDSEKFDVVCNLAAQAGVRYSLENPRAYVDSNIVGFLNLLECCRNYDIQHLVYASSSSVYGLNEKVPFETTDRVDNPISLYAATKKSNELMAHTYTHLFGFPTTGLRFFTVYGPWGRPDMAMFLFTDAIVNNKPIKIFNNGNLERDFTYVDDIVEGVLKILEDDVKMRVEKNNPFKIYNIGNSKSVKLLDFIDAIEQALGKKAKREFLGMQPGDVEKTWANVDDLINDFNYSPNTTITDGVAHFVKWYKEYYDIE
nr:NAD-dependent epimerase [uncultured Allomuricauda sp.]